MTNVEGPSSGLVLYSYWKSSCSWRVRFALQLKGLRYEYRAVDLSKEKQHSSEFKKLNPLGYVPVLLDGDVMVADSCAILLYLEEKYPGRPLLPDDPRIRALNLQLCGVVSSSIQPLHMLSLLNIIEEKLGPEERRLWVVSNIGKGLQALETLLEGFTSKYATGEEIYLADVFLGPQLAVAAQRFSIDLSKLPTLSRLYESYKGLEEFMASSPPRQPDAVS